MDNPMFAQWESSPESPFKEMTEWTYPYAVSYAVYDNIDPLPFDKEGIFGSKLGSLFGKVLPELIMAKSSVEFDKLWDDLQKKRVELGLNQLMKYKQVKINENKAKLGIQ